MKLEQVKRMSHRVLALVLTMVLLLQAMPIVPVTAEAAEMAAVTETGTAEPAETVPAAEEIVPSEPETIPESTTTAPSEEVTVPETEEAASSEAETVPETEVTVSAEAETVPETEEAVPSEAETVPETEVTVPVAAETVPETTETVPSEAETAPATEETAPSKEEKEADPYALLAAAETGRVEVTEAQQLLNGIPEGSTYVLANDIVMNADQQIGVVAGTLDGAGYTITLSGKPLIRTVTGTVQNLMVDGKASLHAGEGSIVCSLSGGKLLNSGSTVDNEALDFNGMGGLVGYSENGTIYNCYFAGTGKDSWGITSISGIMGASQNDSAPSEVKNCYYSAGLNVGGGYAWNHEDGSNGKKKPEEMKQPAFADLLNADITDTGYVWAVSEGNLPVLEAKSDSGATNPQITTAAELPDEIPAGVTYELAADITLEAGQQMSLVAGTLEGNGHTITLVGKPLIRTVTGTVQNLMVDGKASLHAGEGSIVCSLSGGKLLNSGSTVDNEALDFNGMGGLVGYSENGTIYNCYFAGTGKDSWGITSISGIMGASQNEAAPSQLKNCYYSAGLNVGGGYAWNHEDGSNGKKKPEEMKQPAFADLLNTDITDTGYVWVVSEGNLPVLEAKSDSGATNPQITTAAELPDEIPAGVTYELAADITLEAGQQMSLVAGTLEGNGHTITLVGKPLIRTVTGTVQNLMVDGKASLHAGEGSIVCSLSGGKLLNSGSTVDNEALDFNGMGGLVGYSENGTIYNCYFAGTGKDSWGITSISGIMGASQNDSAPSQLKNCYYSAGLNVGGGYAWNHEDGSNGKKKPEEMKQPAFADLLNATNVGTGYIWSVTEGSLPVLVPGGSALEPCNKAELKKVIQEAQSKNEGDYTEASWAAMQEALTAAKNIDQKFDATQKEADEAVKALRKAIDSLEKKERDLSPVEPPKEGVILISSQQDLAKIDGKDPSKFYQLTQDIVIEEGFLAPNLAGVFDGNGHTITVCTPSPLFNNIIETGVVQNLHIKTEGNFTNRYEFAPFADKLKGGMIVNCISQVTGQHSAGFVKKMEDGVMVNCLTMGHNRRGALVFYQKSTDHQNTNGYKSGKFYNCYWSASNAVENITPIDNLVQCEAVGDERLRSDAFIAQLNSQKGKFGASWGRDASGYPYFGEDHGDHVIDGSANRYDVEFVWHDDQVLAVKDGSLELSPQLTGSNRFAGTFRLKGVPADSTISWSCDDRSNQEIMQLEDTGRLFVFHDGGGVVRAVEHKADGTEELAAEIRVVSAAHEIEQLRLVLNGQVIDGAATVQGSADYALEIQAKYAGSEEFRTMPSYLVELKSENPEILHTDYNTAVFWFTRPGTSRLTVTEKTEKQDPVSVTVSITSEYVPVKSVKPAIGGTVQIHYRNSMGSGQFLSLQQSVIVEPANASYKDNFVVESSNPDIAEYSSYSYTPYQPGTVAFTAKLTDKGTVVEGKSQVTFVYTNPLSEVTGPREKITIDQGEKMTLPLTFKGQPGNRHEVTEPDLIWTFDKKGIVSIRRPNALRQIRGTGGPDDGNWVASDEFEVKGLKPGTVVATGTPVDTTSGAKPVKLTITVKGDGSVEGFDIPKFIQTGKKAASNYLRANNSYSFGEEWIIFTLLRDGQTLPQDRLDSYYNDVVTNVHSWKPNILATEIERTALALNVMGKDITNVDGVNLVKMICNHPNLTKQGSNSLAWALLALDMNDTPIPAGMKWSRESIVAELLTYQNEDGGFGLDKKGGSGIDTTAMSVQALARYQHEPEVAQAIEKAVDFLAAVTEKDLNLGNAESIAQVIITLGVLNRDMVEEPGFGDEMENMMSVLAEYMVEGKGFKHYKQGEVDKMATLQSMQALCAYERFLNGQSGYWDLKGTGPVEDPAAKVSKMIADLPENITAADAEAVRAARAAYEALTDSQKKRVRNLEKLERAEKVLTDLLAAQKVMDAIDALPEKITLAQAGVVKAARTAYDRLSAQQKKLVTNIGKLEAAEATLKKLANPESVMELIDALPEKITLADQGAVEAARAAYELLTPEQQAQVTNLKKLERAEKILADLLSAQQVQKVMDAINALPKKITLKDEAAVRAARAAYEQLTAEQQAQVTNLNKLLKAEKAIADHKAAAKVEKLIAALPDPVTLGDEQAVTAARRAYDKLSADQQALVGNADKLFRAEQDMKNLRAAQKVMSMIKELPLQITAADEQAVKAARRAYEALTEDQKKLVMNLYILERAEQVMAELNAVQAVVDAIDALPETVTAEDQEAIEAARAAYNQLTPEQRKQVGNLDKLTAAEKALRALQKPAVTVETESNVVEAVVKDGQVSAQQLEELQGQDKILRIKGTMETGEPYVLSIHGTDIAKAVSFSTEMRRKGSYEKQIHKLAEDPEIFRFLETGAFPGPMMVELETALADGDYLLLQYHPDEQRATLVSRVQAADGKVRFIVEEGGEYFLAKKASSKSIAELEAAEKQEESQPLPTEAQLPQDTEPESRPDNQQKGSNAVLIWLPLGIAAAAGIAIVVLIVLKKRKENNGK